MSVSLLDRRLLFVTGKGGVGKSTVALALGLLAAQRGLRVIVAELAGNDELQRIFGQPGGSQFRELELAPGLNTISVDPQGAMEEYLKLKLPGVAGSALAHSKLFGAFAMATPGMRELLSVGKVWELSQNQRRSPDGDGYDLVVVDAPASGHGVGILRTPQTFAEIARVGPIAQQGSRIAQTIADRSFTAVVAVTTAEEMPVNETFEVRALLGDDGLELDAVVVNQRYADRFDAQQIELIRRWHAAGAAEPGVEPALAAAISQYQRRQGQHEQERRLHAGFGDRLLQLPYIFGARMNAETVAQLAAELDGQLK